MTKISQISPGEGLSEGLSEGLRGLMENSGRGSTRDSGELRGNSGTQGTQTTHFGELRRELRGHLPSDTAPRTYTRNGAVALHAYALDRDSMY